MLKKSTLIIFILALHLIFGLKSTDYCIRKQKECKGYYDKQQNYHTKCKPVKCNGKFNIECGGESNICTSNKIKCTKYKNSLSLFFKIISEIKNNDPLFAAKYLTEKNKIQIFNKHIKDCQNKIYKFKSNDFCLNGQNCVETRKELIGFGFNYRKITLTKTIDCKCPASKSFKCGKYCTTNSITCDYYKLFENQNQFTNITECGNHNITVHRYLNHF
jgi:hypothetical protein